MRNEKPAMAAFVMHRSIRLVPIRHESAGAHMAEGLYKTTGQVGVLNAAQISSLNTAQIQALSTDQVQKLTTADVAALKGNQIVSVESRLGPDLADIQQFETETPKVTPGNYLQVSVTAQVKINSAPTTASGPAAVLPAAAAAAALASAAVPPGPASGARAVAALLEGGL